jgi:catechol 2,3-dioxygenase-like lactoylglutathione lyase family enzyme
VDAELAHRPSGSANRAPSCWRTRRCFHVTRTPSHAEPRVLCGGARYGSGVFLERVTIVVDDYDSAIAFFVDTLGFELIEDSPAVTNDGRPKRWVVVRPRGAQTSILLAQADGDEQAAAVGNQTAGRVGFFLRVDDFDAVYDRLLTNGVTFTKPPRDEPYGRVAVFVDVAGNKWDLLGPRP